MVCSVCFYVTCTIRIMHKCDTINCKWIFALITGKEFQGRRLKVSMARRKPMMGGMRGGMPMRDGMMGRGGKCQHYLIII